MRRFLWAIAALVAAGVLSVGGFYGWANAKHTSCFADFDRTISSQAEGAAAAAGFEVDTLPAHGDTSRVSLRFSTGETGDDARHNLELLGQLAATYDGRPPNVERGCVERSRLD